MQHEARIAQNGAGSTLNDATAPARPKMVASSHGGHKRSLSGSILGRLPFLRPSFEALPLPMLSPKVEEKEEPEETKDVSQDAAPRMRGAMAAMVRQQKTRKRRGSLRKTAIMGTREKRSSVLEQATFVPTQPTGYFTQNPANHSAAQHQEAEHHEVDNDPTPTKEQFGQGWSLLEAQKAQKLALDTDSAVSKQNEPQNTEPSPIISPTSGPYASTTDDDEGLTFSRPTSTNLHPPPSQSFFQSPAANTSSLLRRRSTVKPSPLTRASPEPLQPSEWDYTETERWGWVVLAVTWIVFVVGMGSCLGVWSWAWDVGETPRAPPDLEDDPTLPIVGYYPALIILTAVMSWVWVIVAWVGIKTFRHAKVVGDE
ncbi:hypothetical protein NA57DRAFT_77507 [Rhizodiscina lignyota]|uniref:Uncharacterized protein n=1 Tax=Rhizodiscina lignyota TaxID=1504668 RepID=A0A9P4IDB5_9PEZI|nr:hypothetical protein NA57DRAFT_77507 [Rhizodiscina lignyota]